MKQLVLLVALLLWLQEAAAIISREYPLSRRNLQGTKHHLTFGVHLHVVSEKYLAPRYNVTTQGKHEFRSISFKGRIFDVRSDAAFIIDWILDKKEGEGMVSEAFNRVLRMGDSQDTNIEHGHCTSYARKQYGNKHAIVLDIGANAGFYGLYAAAVGCRTYFFDIQPTCVNWINSAIDKNQFHHAAIIPFPISNITETLHLDQQSNGCHGTFTFSKTGDEYYKTEQKLSLPLDVQMYRLDDIFAGSLLNNNIGGPIALIKIDVEGYEPNVIASMHKLLRHKQIDTGKGTVRTIVTEISPTRWAGLPHGGLTRGQVASIICETVWDAGFHKVVYFSPLPDNNEMKVLDTREHLYEYIKSGSFASISQDFFFTRTHVMSGDKHNATMVTDEEYFAFQDTL